MLGITFFLLYAACLMGLECVYRAIAAPNPQKKNGKKKFQKKYLGDAARAIYLGQLF